MCHKSQLTTPTDKSGNLRLGTVLAGVSNPETEVTGVEDQSSDLIPAVHATGHFIL